MPTTLVLGLQWGDEGKGKIADILAEDADYVIRFQGGANSGHTVIVGDEKFVFHCIPSGIIRQNVKCVLGRGMVLDLLQLKGEIQYVIDKGISVDGRIQISPRAHIVLPHHKLFDKARELAAGDAKIGTTGRGIGPCYAEKANRTGVQIGDLLDLDYLKTRLRASVVLANKTLKNVFGIEAPAYENVLSELLSTREFLLPHICETEIELLDAYHQGKNLLFEGAQAVMLDLDSGTYPFVTSSSVIAAGVSAGCGFPAKYIDRIVGVSKAYCTRVGTGPFPSELFDDRATYLREKGMEFGTTTNRPRRTGWIDLVALKSVIRFNLVDEIFLTKLDVMTALDEIRQCVEYDLDSYKTSEFPHNSLSIQKAKALYRNMKGWTEDIQNAKDFADLPVTAKEFIDSISDFVGVPVTCVSVGPKRNQRIYKA